MGAGRGEGRVVGGDRVAGGLARAVAPDGGDLAGHPQVEDRLRVAVEAQDEVLGAALDRIQPRPDQLLQRQAIGQRFDQPGPRAARRDDRPAHAGALDDAADRFDLG